MDCAGCVTWPSAATVLLGRDGHPVPRFDASATREDIIAVLEGEDDDRAALSMASVRVPPGLTVDAALGVEGVSHAALVPYSQWRSLDHREREHGSQLRKIVYDYFELSFPARMKILAVHGLLRDGDDQVGDGELFRRALRRAQDDDKIEELAEAISVALQQRL